MKNHKHADAVSRRAALDDEMMIDVLFHGFARCMEAERRLDECASNREIELAREQLCQVKLELQQVLGEYVDSRIGRWLGARADVGA